MTRFFDITFSLLALITFTPFLLLVVLILIFSGEKKVIYKQNRIGKYGREFSVFKFATMLENSELIGTRDITLHNDPRVLPFGKILRKTKINELPQLINVIRGDIGLIGPRPQTPRYFMKYTPQTRIVIASVLPGLSGIGSILFRNEEDMVKDCTDPISFHDQIVVPYKGMCEEWFVANRSICLYFKLIFLTIWTVIFRGNDVQKYLISKLPIMPSELNKIYK